MTAYVGTDGEKAIRKKESESERNRKIEIDRQIEKDRQICRGREIEIDRENKKCSLYVMW